MVAAEDLKVEVKVNLRVKHAQLQSRRKVAALFLQALSFASRGRGHCETTAAATNHRAPSAVADPPRTLTLPPETVRGLRQPLDLRLDPTSSEAAVRTCLRNVVQGRRGPNDRRRRQTLVKPSRTRLWLGGNSTGRSPAVPLSMVLRVFRQLHRPWEL